MQPNATEIAFLTASYSCASGILQLKFDVQMYMECRKPLLPPQRGIMSQIPAVPYFVSSSSLVGRYFRLAGVHDGLRSSVSYIW